MDLYRSIENSMAPSIQFAPIRTEAIQSSQRLVSLTAKWINSDLAKLCRILPGHVLKRSKTKVYCYSLFGVSCFCLYVANFENSHAR